MLARLALAADLRCCPLIHAVDVDVENKTAVEIVIIFIKKVKTGCNAII